MPIFCPMNVVLWGMVAGSALFLGAAIGWKARLPRRMTALLTAFGAGILLAVAAFDLLGEALVTGGLVPVAGGFLTGAVIFTLGLLRLDRAGARHRKRSTAFVGLAPPGAVVGLATVLDSLPEALIIGLSFSRGESLGLASVIAVILANMPESISATTRMRTEGRSTGFVLGLWSAATLATGAFALVGYSAYVDLSAQSAAFTMAVAGGALIVYVADYMIPEAFEEAHEASGLITALGFLIGLALLEGLG